MDILVIDRESLTNQLISSKLTAKGHTVTVESNKNEAFEKIKAHPYDCIMLDPYPLSEARPVVMGIWKSLANTPIKPYLLLLSKAATPEEAILSGANDVLIKPFSSLDIDTKICNAARMMEIVRHLAKEDNVHSFGGMIGKAAFNQLYLSAIDRAFRYGERSLIVFIDVMNFDEITALGEKANEIMQKLTEKITFMRRQSDVVGRLGPQSFGILLQRPQYETEPTDAINRFSEMLGAFYREFDFDSKAIAPTLELNLVELPQGVLHEVRTVPAASITDALDKEAPTEKESEHG
jgi:PleD family two-component response regulator